MAELRSMLSPATSVWAGFLGLALSAILFAITITPHLILFTLSLLGNAASIDPNVCIGVSMILLGAAMLAGCLRNRRARARQRNYCASKRAVALR